jgi:hypothetical protein
MTDENIDRNEDQPCLEKEASQFDFWLGRWQVGWGENKTGTNQVEKILHGCVIREQFDGRPGTVLEGVSLSRFDPALGLWRQTWVDNAGNYFEFKGSWQNDRMVLSREKPGADGQVWQRMVWFDIAPKSLKWNWERSEDGGQNWDLLWQLKYRRRFE